MAAGSKARWEWPVVGAIGLAGVAVAGILFWFDPEHSGIYPVCALHQVTGLSCPGCGSLRAMHQLLHGRIGAALHFNAVLVLSIPLVAWLAYRAHRFRRGNRPMADAIPMSWLWGFFVVAVVFGVVRNLPLARNAGWGP